MPIINQIVKNPGTPTKYGISIDSILGEVYNNILQKPNGGERNITLTGFNSVSERALAYKFYGNTRLRTLDASNITEIENPNGCVGMLEGCSSLTTLNMSNLIRLTGSTITTNSTGACYKMCAGCSNLTTVDFSNLSVITKYGMTYCFMLCSSLTSLSLPSLTELDDCALYIMVPFSNITQVTLGGTSQITLNGNPFSSMFGSCSQNITVNAPAANQVEIEALTGYPNFGGTGTVTWNWIS